MSVDFFTCNAGICIVSFEFRSISINPFFGECIFEMISFNSDVDMVSKVDEFSYIILVTKSGTINLTFLIEGKFTSFNNLENTSKFSPIHSAFFNSFS